MIITKFLLKAKNIWDSTKKNMLLLMSWNFKDFIHIYKISIIFTFHGYVNTFCDYFHVP